MPIRYKLLSLLLFLSLPAVILLGVLTLHGFHSMSLDITAESSQRLIEHNKFFLKEKTSDLANIIKVQSGLVEEALRNQASAVERLLASPAPVTKYFTATDFDAHKLATLTDNLYSNIDKNGNKIFVEVSRDYASFHLVPGTESAPDIKKHILQLNQMTSFYKFQLSRSTTMALWHYTSLENGVHNVFPGHGQYPSNYDGRKRPWYVNAVKQGDLVWTKAIVDASTGKVITTASMPVYYPDKRLAGVTAIDLPINNTFAIHTQTEKWLKDAKMLLLSISPEISKIRIEAKQEILKVSEQWEENKATEYFGENIEGSYKSLLSLNKNNNVILLEYKSQNTDYLASITPLVKGKSYVALIIPNENVYRAAQQVQAIIEKQETVQTRYYMVALIMLGILIIIIVAIISNSIAAIFSHIKNTAHAIADGNLESRIETIRNDEVGDLINSINQMADSIQELQEAQEKAQLQEINSLSRALERRDTYTATHSGRVAKYSTMLGECIGLSEDMLDRLRLGALMHDLGKIGIRDEILNKSDALSADERCIMRQHPIFSAKIMKPLVRFREFADIANWHHERWDGTGYPDHLKGEEIPLLARIVAIADTWDAMTGDRIYRKGISDEEAISKLEAELESGQWDPELLRQFIDMVKNEQKNKEGWEC